MCACACSQNDRFMCCGDTCPCTLHVRYRTRLLLTTKSQPGTGLTVTVKRTNPGLRAVRHLPPRFVPHVARAEWAWNAYVLRHGTNYHLCASALEVFRFRVRVRFARVSCPRLRFVYHLCQHVSISSRSQLHVSIFVIIALHDSLRCDVAGLAFRAKDVPVRSGSVVAAGSARS